MEQKFYFTFGSSENQPYRGGWVEIYAKDEEEARGIFDLRFGRTPDGFLAFAFCYSEESFRKTVMYELGNNLGAGCHLILRLSTEPSVLDSDLIATRINTLRTCDTLIRNIVDDEEVIIDHWLALGVPDAYTDNDLSSIAEDNQAYTEVLEAFVTSLKLDKDRGTWR